MRMLWLLLLWVGERVCVCGCHCLRRPQRRRSFTGWLRIPSTGGALQNHSNINTGMKTTSVSGRSAESAALISVFFYLLY